MRYIRHDFAQLDAGDTVQVHISYAANVQLLTPLNMERYHNRESYRYYGGYRSYSPVEFTIPYKGFWHVAVDLGGRAGSITSSAVVIRKAEIESLAHKLNSLIEKAPQAIRQVEADLRPRRVVYEFDTFINHASEDKDAFVRPLVGALESKGVKVWYDESSINAGEGLRESIDAGISKCRFGIVVLSAGYVHKEWAKAELDALFALNTRIIPIWHNIRADDVKAFSPLVAGKRALLTEDYDIDGIASTIFEMVDHLNKNECLEGESGHEEQ